MNSDLEKLFSGLFQFLGALRERLGALAWVALGVLLVLGIVFCILVLRWIKSGGLAPGYSRRFFVECGETQREGEFNRKDRKGYRVDLEEEKAEEKD
jgi:hypothetical protein